MSVNSLLDKVRRDGDQSEVTDVLIDRDSAFMLYATFCGDVERTAHALGCRPVDVLEVAKMERWDEQLKSIIELKKSSRPGDVERAVNRALNFVQAHRFRTIVERVMRHLYEMEQTELVDFVTTSVRASTKADAPRQLSAKSLADLATAMEKAQAMSYLALVDTATDRSKRKAELDSDNGAQSLHIQIASAMAKVGGSNSASAQLFDRQLEQAQEVLATAKAKKPE
ncbi:MAG: hypothetical protein ACYST6_05745 [Planctomycetota bacterium]|jgi:hypothetical protein